MSNGVMFFCIFLAEQHQHILRCQTPEKKKGVPVFAYRTVCSELYSQ